MIFLAKLLHGTIGEVLGVIHDDATWHPISLDLACLDKVHDGLFLYFFKQYRL